MDFIDFTDFNQTIFNAEINISNAPENMGDNDGNGGGGGGGGASTGSGIFQPGGSRLGQIL